MIINLFVIDQGICIYSFDFKKNIYVDENLLSGFLTAVGSFAQETFQTGLQAIQIRNGQKLIFFIENEQKLTFCAVADERDNNHLLEQILGEIARNFTAKLSKVLNSSERNRADAYRIFDPLLKEILKDKAKPRDRKSMCGGICGGLLSLYLLILLAGIIAESLSNIPEDTLYVILYFYISGVLSTSSFIAGFLAGNPKIGLKTGVIFFIVLIFLIIILVPSLMIILIYALPFAFIACGAAGYYGGLIRDRKKLYPLEI